MRRKPLLLAVLAPVIVKTVPNDPFTGKPLIYKRTEKGYSLSSVGPNLKDDGGKNSDPSNAHVTGLLSAAQPGGGQEEPDDIAVKVE